MTRRFTAREFNQDLAAAKRATQDGPVIVTDRGVPAHVLLSIDEYRRLTERRGSLAERLASDDTIEIDFQADRKLSWTPRDIDLD